MVDEKVTTDVVAEDNDDSDESKTYDADYVRKLKAEAKEYRTAKSVLKKEYEETKAKLEAIEAEKVTETEKDKKRIAELEKKLADTDKSIKDKDIDTYIIEAISDKNIIDKSTMKLLIKQELASEENIDAKVVDKVVDKLIKDKPYLIGSTNIIPGDGNFKKKDGELAKSTDQMFGEFLHGRK